MAGNLKPAETKKLLESLSGVNRKLDSCLQSLEDSQKMLEKCMKCQMYLNYSLKPVQTGFTVTENTSGGLDNGNVR